MNVTPNPNDDVHGAQPEDAPHGATHGEGAHVDAAHADHAQGASLGPVDWRAWGAGLLGTAAGLVIAACLFLSTTR